MKAVPFIFAVVLAAMNLNVAQAGTGNDCKWYVPGAIKRFGTVTLPSSIYVSNAPIGSVMASSPPLDAMASSYLTCQSKQVTQSVKVEQAVLAEGFPDVYQTGVTGVGVRISDSLYARVYPYSRTWNAIGFIDPIRQVRIEYIRTSRGVATGDATLKFFLLLSMNGVDMQEVSFVGNTNIQAGQYFSGCEGVEKISIFLGHMSMADIGEKSQAFNLDVICSGLPAGTKVPVRVYFDGDSDGPGRLNLEPDGASGIEILLVTDRSVKLPFSMGSALAMTWIRSEPTGEIYRLPVVAAYEKKASQKVKGGRANATLNYILEYN